MLSTLKNILFKSSGSNELEFSKSIVKSSVKQFMKTLYFLISKEEITKDDIKDNMDDIINHENMLRNSIINIADNDTISLDTQLIILEHTAKKLESITVCIILLLIISERDIEASERIDSPDVGLDNFKEMNEKLSINKIVLALTDHLMELDDIK